MIIACTACRQKNNVPAARLDCVARCGACANALLPLAAPFVVADAATFDDIIGASPVPVVVDFWATWCGPCRAVAPELDKLAAAFAGSAIILKVDTDALKSIAGRYSIRGIPAFIRFDSGQETARAKGAMTAAALARSLRLDSIQRT